MSLKIFLKKEFSFFLLLLLICNSCQYTLSKEQYLVDYASFINDVKQNYQSYDQEKWKQQDIEFEKYNKDLFQQFNTQLSPTEQARLIRFDFVYNLVRGNINLSDLISGKYNQALSGYVTELTAVLNEATLIQKDIKDVISLDLLNKLIQPTNPQTN